MNAWRYRTFVCLMMGFVAACSTPAPTAAPTDAAAPPAPTAAVAASKVAADVPAAAPAPAPKAIEVPAGTAVGVILTDSLSSGTNKTGDEFAASLAEPLKVDGAIVLAKGTKFRGRVVEAEESGRVKGRANIHLILTGIIRDQKVVPIVTNTYIEEAEATKGRDAGIVGGAAGVGAAIGAIAGGTKGAGVGAVIGGAGGTGAVLATRGKEVSLAPESKLTFKLEKAVAVVP